MEQALTSHVYVIISAAHHRAESKKRKSAVLSGRRNCPGRLRGFQARLFTYKLCNAGQIVQPLYLNFPNFSMKIIVPT